MAVVFSKVILAGVGSAGVANASVSIQPGKWDHRAGQNPWMDRVRHENELTFQSFDAARKTDGTGMNRFYKDTQGVTYVDYCFDTTVPKTRKTTGGKVVVRDMVADGIQHFETALTENEKKYVQFRDIGECSNVTTHTVDGGSLKQHIKIEWNDDEKVCVFKAAFTATTNGDFEFPGVINLSGCGNVEVSAASGTKTLEYEGDAEFLESVIHEFGHALGMQHEHQRSDRATNYPSNAGVTFTADDQENILTNADTQLPFDHDSVMIYGQLTPYGVSSSSGNPGSGKQSPDGTLYENYKRTPGLSYFDKAQIQRGFWYQAYEYVATEKKTYCKAGYHRKNWKCVPCQGYNQRDLADLPGDTACVEDWVIPFVVVLVSALVAAVTVVLLRLFCCREEEEVDALRWTEEVDSTNAVAKSDNASAGDAQASALTTGKPEAILESWSVPGASTSSNWFPTSSNSPVDSGSNNHVPVIVGTTVGVTVCGVALLILHRRGKLPRFFRKRQKKVPRNVFMGERERRW